MIVNTDAVSGLGLLENKSITLLWTDPPFGTGEKQQIGDYSYQDGKETDALQLVVDMVDAAMPKLAADATVAICLDYRIVHEAKVEINKRLCFEREIIYHFELGGVSRSWWSNKHNTILLFSLGNPKFNFEAVPVIPRKAPKKEYSKDRRVNSVWSMTMNQTDPQRVGWPTQKPLELVEPFVAVHTDVGDLVVDPFAGSGTVGVAAQSLQRRYAMFDVSAEAVALMSSRGLS